MFGANKVIGVALSAAVSLLPLVHAAPASAIGPGVTRSDPDDVTGPVDIATYSVTADATNATLSFTTYADFTPADLQLATWVIVSPTSAGAIAIANDSGTLKGAFAAEGSQTATPVAVSQP